MQTAEFEDDRVDELAEEFAQRLRTGERPSVEGYISRFPHLADRIRDVLAGVALMEQFKPRRTDMISSSDNPPLPERVGEFRMVRQIGRGGMGVVYEAEQETLGRRVAIKVMPGNLLANDRMRERFRREAQAAARLHHTNIVPVFGTGESEGQCFYVMQLIHGHSLDCVLQTSRPGDATASLSCPVADQTPIDSVPNSPTPRSVGQGRNSLGTLPIDQRAREVARIGVQVADALAYAHSRGIVHRDIKPSNLLIDPIGVVWVTDFGVAKVVEEADLTISGDLVGTLRYMPPERFSGRSDARGDVYSLGVTLYELLTLQAAFPDTSPQHLIRLITQQPLVSPRRINPAIPADLETIVLKACAGNPDRRYQSPAELREDLQRFLDDRPILARRISPQELAWRWCRQNPALATAITAAFVLMITVTVVSAYASAKTAAANREAQEALAAEKIQRRQAEANSDLALTALNRMYDRFAPSRLIVAPEQQNADGVALPVQPALPPEAAALLEHLLLTYEQVATSSGEFPRLHAQAAEANHRIGDIRQRLGRHEQAAVAYRAALDLYAKLSDSSHSTRIKRARTYNELGCTLRTLQQQDEADQMHNRAVEVLTQKDETFTKRPECRYELARTYYALDRHDMMTSSPGGRGDHPPPPRPKGKHEEPQDHWDWPPPPHDHPKHGPPDRRHPEPGRPPRARAIPILEQLVRDFPTVPEYRHLLACCYRDTHPEPQRGGPPRRKEDRGVTLLRQLVADFPQMPDYRFDLCETLARPRPGPGRKEPSTTRESNLQEAIDLSAELVRQYPTIPDYVAAHARYIDLLGVSAYESGKPKEAETFHCRAISHQSRLVKEYPEITAYGFWLSLMERSLGRALAQRGKIQDARTQLESATRRLETLRKKDPRLSGVRTFLATFYRELAQVLIRLGEKDLAARASTRATELDPRGAFPPGRKPHYGEHH